jgi:hypothetical protein
MASIGPKLPPGLELKRRREDDTESDSDQSESEAVGGSANDSDSDDDVIGPMPPPADGSGPSLAASAAEAIERRQLAMRKKLEDAEVSAPPNFETEGFDLPCTAEAGLGLLVKLRLMRIGADEGARERTRTFEIRLVPAATGRDIPIKRADRHAIIYHVMHQRAPWDNAGSGSYLIT